MESAIESTGIIHRVIGDQSYWYQFRWGSLLDFPHYQLGDSIQWNDYVFGEPEVRLAFVKATGIEDLEATSTCELRTIELPNSSMILRLWRESLQNMRPMTPTLTASPTTLVPIDEPNNRQSFND